MIWLLLAVLTPIEGVGGLQAWTGQRPAAFVPVTRSSVGGDRRRRSGLAHRAGVRHHDRESPSIDEACARYAVSCSRVSIEV